MASARVEDDVERGPQFHEHLAEEHGPHAEVQLGVGVQELLDKPRRGEVQRVELAEVLAAVDRRRLVPEGDTAAMLLAQVGLLHDLGMLGVRGEQVLAHCGLPRVLGRMHASQLQQRWCWGEGEGRLFTTRIARGPTGVGAREQKVAGSGCSSRTCCCQLSE